MLSHGGVCGVGVVLCENCIVDASIFIFCCVAFCNAERANVMPLWCGVGVLVVVVVLFFKAHGGCLGISSR